MSKVAGDSPRLEVVAIALGGLVSLALAPERIGLWQSMVGLIMLALLLQHFCIALRSLWMDIAYAGTLSLTLIAVVGVVLEWISSLMRLDVRHVSVLGENIAPCRDITFFALWSVSTAVVFCVRKQITSEQEDQLCPNCQSR